ncbi:hypothetical protein A3Q56_02637 [Intoshia linei]|uniref:DNA topoisomerase n=1 Tax=Intoshia linei TaxID=1819745 RepID=A0A177B7H5_9BILA|nr:hypothetical protein A3Q56_02637 [Intoshia linei]
MIKILNVAEKNDAAKSIARILSNNHCITKEGKSVYNKNYEFICKIDNVNCKMTMTSVCGHVSNIEFDDTHRNWNNVDPKSLFTAKINENYLDNNLKIKSNEVKPKSPFQFTGNFGLQKRIDKEPENILPIDIFNHIIDENIINIIYFVFISTSHICGTVNTDGIRIMKYYDKREVLISTFHGIKYDLIKRKSRNSKELSKPRKNLQNEIMKADKLIIWTDCDREGENIGFEIIRICSAVKKITIKRAKFSEITHRSIFKAINTLVDPDELLNKAVDVRKELDLRIGAAFTRFQTMRLRNLFPNILNETMSYGSCQFPTVGFVVERFKQNQEFKVEMFVKIIMNHTKDKLKTNFYWHRLRLFDHPMCLAIYGYMLQNPISKVTKIESKRKTKWRPLPLETVSFQKLCSRKLYMTAKKGMQIIEKLYNKGFVSYPRTETNIFPDSLNLREAVNHQVSHDQWGGLIISLMCGSVIINFFTIVAHSKLKM